MYPKRISAIILELIRALSRRPHGVAHLLDQDQSCLHVLVTLNNSLIARSCTGDVSFEYLPYQLSMEVYVATMVVTGNGELGFDSGEGA